MLFIRRFPRFGVAVCAFLPLFRYSLAAIEEDVRNIKASCLFSLANKLAKHLRLNESEFFFLSFVGLLLALGVV